MKIGLIDVDGHNFPNLALMKISAYHKSLGDLVEWCIPLCHYDIVYQSKVFSEQYSKDIDYIPNADKIIKGGTGYAIRLKNGREVYEKSLDKPLPLEIEKQFPDYSIYPELAKDTAYGFLTRGCPNNCDFCIVSKKECRRSVKVSDLVDFWNGQKFIKLLDPNILACKEHPQLLEQLVKSKAYIDFTQGIDSRLLTRENILMFNAMKMKNIHFAWDFMKNEKSILNGLSLYAELATHKPHGHLGAVYVLTNYNTSFEEDLYRVITLRDMNYDPYVMIYNKPSAPLKTRYLQRWCNNKIIFRKEPDFEKYNPKLG